MTALMRTVPSLRDQSFKTYAASGPEQVRPDLAAFERMDEDALRSASKQAFKVCLAKVQPQLAQVVVAPTRMSDAQSWTSSSCLPERKVFEVVDVIDAEDDGFAINDEPLLSGCKTQTL